MRVLLWAVFHVLLSSQASEGVNKPEEIRDTPQKSSSKLSTATSTPAKEGNLEKKPGDGVHENELRFSLSELDPNDDGKAGKPRKHRTTFKYLRLGDQEQQAFYGQPSSSDQPPPKFNIVLVIEISLCGTGVVALIVLLVIRFKSASP